jgi:hypothetical protein
MENASTLSGIPPHSQTGPEPHPNPNLAAALDYFDRGFKVIPVVPGTKKSAVKWDPWLNGLTREVVQDTWSNQRYDVGAILGPDLYVLDSDSPEAEAAIQTTCAKHGIQSNKIVKTKRGYHHYFSLTPGTTINSRTFSTEHHPSRIDVKTGRSMMVMPPSGGRYLITTGSPTVTELIVVTSDFIEAVRRHNAPETGLKPIPKALAAPNDPRQLSGKECRILIDHLDPDMHHDDWIKVGMALHHNFGSGDEGLELFDYWSSKGGSYPGRKELEQKWRSFKHLRDLGRPGYTMGTVCRMVEDLGHDWQMVCADAQGAFEVCAPITTAKPLEEQFLNVIERYSVLGRLAEFEARLRPRFYVLPGIALSGQITALYSSTNVGKTLTVLALIQALILKGQIESKNVCYFNADDNLDGTVEKLRIAERCLFHTVLPGERGFETKKLPDFIEELINSGHAPGKILIIDTLKKFTEIMSKDKSSTFMDLLRRFTMAQGTVIILTHTNKDTRADGSPIPGGTSDVPEDSDAVFTMRVDPKSNQTPEKIVIFESRKTRGGEPGPFRYAFLRRGTYEEIVASVREITTVELDDFEPVEPDDDDRLIGIVKDAIRGGFTKKMSLRDEVSRVGGVSKARALKVIELHTGPVPSLHHWNFEVGARGANNYILLDCGSDNHTQLDDGSSVNQEAF